MRIQYASDLHLEFEGNRSWLSKNGLKPVGDILILAGDITYLGVPDVFKCDFFDWCSKHFSQTLIVPGNHEFYGGFDVAETLSGFDYKVRDNVRYLNNQSAVIGDTELFLTTLWTKIDPICLPAIQQGMNDFRLARYKGKALNASNVDDLHQQCLSWLDSAIACSVAKHKVVITHHCPTCRREFNNYPDSVLNSAFQVNLDAYIEHCCADCWIYGHTHFNGGSGMQIGATLLFSNQLGYVFHNEQLFFSSAAVVEL